MLSRQIIDPMKVSETRDKNKLIFLNNLVCKFIFAQIKMNDVTFIQSTDHIMMSLKNQYRVRVMHE
jgi:hypothetical protein